MRKLIVGLSLFLLVSLAAASNDVASVIASEKHAVAVANNNDENIQKLQQSLSDLQVQLQRLNLEFSDFRQQATARLEAVGSNTAVVQTRIAAISQSLDHATQSIAALQKKQEKSEENLLNRWSRDLGIDASWLILGIAGLLLLLILGSFFRGAKKSTIVTSAASETTPGEYDLMSSAEGIPAKLNLASAYIEMGNKEAARNLLQEVLKQGDAAQKQAAQGLLEKAIKN